MSRILSYVLDFAKVLSTKSPKKNTLMAIRGSLVL